jgi:hypothetical protein
MPVSNICTGVVDRSRRELDELAVLTGWDTKKYEWYVQQHQSRLKQDRTKRNTILPISNKHKKTKRLVDKNYFFIITNFFYNWGVGFG